MTSPQKLQTEGLFELKKKAGEGLCPVKGCRKQGHSNKMGLCHAHHQYRWRMRSPKRCAYSTLRDHAKQRGLKFTISYDYFLGVTDALVYWSGEGYPTIDRVDATKGYEMGNITVLPHSENVAKGNKERHLPAHVQSILDRKRARACIDSVVMEEDDTCPF